MLFISAGIFFLIVDAIITAICWPVTNWPPQIALIIIGSGLIGVGIKARKQKTLPITQPLE